MSDFIMEVLDWDTISPAMRRKMPAYYESICKETTSKNASAEAQSWGGGAKLFPSVRSVFYLLQVWAGSITCPK